MENIIENNRLIAKFMGLKEQTDPTERWFGLFFDKGNRVGGSVKEPLLYHSSWDWLMPVVDKIYDTYEYTTYINNLGQFSEGVWVNTKFIEITYETVVDFIKWFNSQQNN